VKKKRRKGAQDGYGCARSAHRAQIRDAALLATAFTMFRR